MWAGTQGTQNSRKALGSGSLRITDHEISLISGNSINAQQFSSKKLRIIKEGRTTLATWWPKKLVPFQSNKGREEIGSSKWRHMRRPGSRIWKGMKKKRKKTRHWI